MNEKVCCLAKQLKRNKTVVYENYKGCFMLISYPFVFFSNNKHQKKKD